MVHIVAKKKLYDLPAVRCDELNTIYKMSKKFPLVFDLVYTFEEKNFKPYVNLTVKIDCESLKYMNIFLDFNFTNNSDKIVDLYLHADVQTRSNDHGSIIYKKEDGYIFSQAFRFDDFIVFNRKIILDFKNDTIAEFTNMEISFQRAML